MHNVTFRSLWESYYNKARLFTYSYTHDECIAEDIASEVIIKVWERLKVIGFVEKLDVYVLTTTKNMVLNYLRSQRIRQRVYTDFEEKSKHELEFRIATLQATSPDVVFLSEVRNIVNDTLNKLSPRTREIFLKSRFEGYSYEEIAQEMGITVKGVCYHLSKATEIIRVQLKDYLYLICPLLYLLYLFSE